MAARKLIVFKSGQGPAGPAGTAGSGTGVATFKDVSVTGSTVISETPVNDALLVVRITQDGTGHPVTWSSDFMLAPAVENAPSLVSLTMWAGFGGKWWPCAVPVLGMKP